MQHTQGPGFHPRAAQKHGGECLPPPPNTWEVKAGKPTVQETLDHIASWDCFKQQRNQGFDSAALFALHCCYKGTVPS